MNRMISAILCLILLFQNLFCAVSASVQTNTLKNIEITELPPGTTFKISMQSTINSFNARKKSTIAATLTEDLVANNKILAPKGSIVYGEITKVRQNIQCVCDGIVGFSFNEIVTPDNKHIKVKSKDFIFATEVTNEFDRSSLGYLIIIPFYVFIAALLQSTSIINIPYTIENWAEFKANSILALGGVILVPLGVLKDRGIGTEVVIQAGTPLEVVVI